MAETQPRFEFRIWGCDLSAVRARAEAIAKPGPARASAETYIVSRATDRCNAKIRDGLMDIKLLAREEAGLEQWRPEMKEGFPLESATIAKRVFPSLAIQAPQLRRPSYPLDLYLEEVIRPNPKLAIAEVSKRRLGFTIAGCIVEFAEVTINGAPFQTLEAESEDPVELRRALSMLGLGAEHNINYVRQIKSVMGIGPANHGVAG